MNKIKEIFNSPQTAENYDCKTKKSNWRGPEVLLGLSFPWIKPEESILDLGIGTGLVAAAFAKAGLKVYGMDFSVEMLKVCRDKNITVELKKHDLLTSPYPYETDSMDHAVCGGVMHLFEDPGPILREVSRIVRKGGIFAFSTFESEKADCKSSVYECKHGKAVAYYHTPEYIEALLDDSGFKVESSLQFFVNVHEAQRRMRAYIAKN